MLLDVQKPVSGLHSYEGSLLSRKPQDVGTNGMPYGFKSASKYLESSLCARLLPSGNLKSRKKKELGGGDVPRLKEA